jgi:hypothetical protein
MSVKIDPEAVEILNGQRVDVYDLPIDDNTALDLNIRGEGYTAEWETSLGLAAFDKLIRKSIIQYETTPAKAAFEDRDSIVESEFSQLRTIEGYPESGTYLVVEPERYDLAWEGWDEGNRLVLNVPSGDHRVLERYFLETVSESIDRKVADLSFGQAKKILQE